MAKGGKKQEAAGPGHNVQSDREAWEEQQFLNCFRDIETLESDMAGTKGEIGGVYKRGESAGGWTKADFKWAKELKGKDVPKLVAMMERRLRIARMFGHPIARQFEMFDADRAPADERAYQEGLAAGKLRARNENPYGADNHNGQEWQRGFNDGTAFINRDLAAQFETGDPDELIKSGEEDEDTE